MCLYRFIFKSCWALKISADCLWSYLQVLRIISVGLDSHSNQVSLAMWGNPASFSRTLQHTDAPKQILATFYCWTIFLSFDTENEGIFCLVSSVQAASSGELCCGRTSMEGKEGLHIAYWSAKPFNLFTVQAEVGSLLRLTDEPGKSCHVHLEHHHLQHEDGPAQPSEETLTEWRAVALPWGKGVWARIPICQMLSSGGIHAGGNTWH